MTPPHIHVNIVTFNLLNKPSRWRERRFLIADELAQIQPDLIALQEVALPDNNAEWLASRLGHYSVHVCSKTGPLEGKEGIAILSRLPVERVRTLDLRTQHRVAQLVQVRQAHQSVMVVNGHFYFHVVDHIERVRQIQHLLGWLDHHTRRRMPTIICGDFNDTPGSRSICLMRQRFVSAHAARHGREPDYTCPTPLRYQLSTVRTTLSRLGNYALNRSFAPWRGTVDYIFVNPQVHVVECKSVLNRPAPHDRTLYPSDHVGLAATLTLA
ncbi:MAG: endonuclease/exonuclease/phosphatase family protein [Chloroflexi bacterium]|nr:endonuclease/exonuclease/phosphatase family protein [Chloroflexota bacterium]